LSSNDLTACIRATTGFCVSPQEDCCQALSVPPPRKYEPDGGPGIRRIIELLQGSDEPEADRRLFLKAQIVFWLLGETDGHAKNFSIFLLPRGRFRMTPLYDVTSAQPNVEAGEIPRNRMKLAMAVGDSRHYVIDTILPRHFLQTAARSGVADALVQGIFDELMAQVPSALDSVLSALPRGFPAGLTASIGAGVRRRLQLIAAC
jgi:serine/threonine-protein kinase HipA